MSPAFKRLKTAFNKPGFAPTLTPLRPCQICGGLIPRRKGIKPYDYKQLKTCSRYCNSTIPRTHKPNTHLVKKKTAQIKFVEGKLNRGVVRLRELQGELRELLLKRKKV